MTVLICTRRILNVGKHRYLRPLCTGVNAWNTEISTKVKHDIEKHWKDKIDQTPPKSSDKYFVLSMFPYPSGKLHMGHVRVYTISDTVARYNRMNGKYVVHPMGWDAFGLPAENAAIERNIAPSKWTRDNIATMREQLRQLGCSFDWSREFATCDPEYYKWTQHLFLQLLDAGLVYQKDSLVNWDPIDQTVLADEQVDVNGCSWRSGAKVERKALKQWFIRTTRFAKSLLDGLSDPILEEWRDIIKLQKHWIGECNGVLFDFQITPSNNLVTLWTEHPEYIEVAAFIAVAPDSQLGLLNPCDVTSIISETAIIPLTGKVIPIFVTNEIQYAPGTDCHVGIPFVSDTDQKFAEKNQIPIIQPKIIPQNHEEKLVIQQDICKRARELNVGGDWTSSKLRDWLISRQRFWGTPIPIIHCKNCGAQPVPKDQLPVKLPALDQHSRKGLSPLLDATEWLNTTCPKCKNAAKRETDTMDTFVDSSWYFLRFMDPNNTAMPFSRENVMKLSPVDLYIGGKEHGVLHLYYARFVHHFLHSLGLVPEREPFKRLLVQGMVMGRSYRLKGTGQYLPESDVDVVNVKKRQAVHKPTQKPVVIAWEKMSKSKLNGVDPEMMFTEYGIDTTRLLIMADVAPTSPRNWTSATFPGILNWQKRLWLTLNDFRARRATLPAVDLHGQSFREQEERLYDSRNYYVKGVSFNFLSSQQFSVAISKMQGLTNTIRQSAPDVIAHGAQYERALAAQLIMLAPMAPHFASELWAGFTSAPNRINTQSTEIDWDRMVLEQRWPDVDMDYQCSLMFKVNGSEHSIYKLPRFELDQLTYTKAVNLAMAEPKIIEIIDDRKISNILFNLYKGVSAEISIYTHYRSKNKIEQNS